MSNFRILWLGRGLLATLTILGLLLGCNGGIVRPDAGSTYRISGLITVDHNRDKTMAAANFRKDSAPAVTGSVKLDGTSLTFDRPAFAVDSVHSAEWNSVVQFATGNHTITASDSTDLSVQTVVTRLPGTLSIIGITPPNRISNGNELVKLDWFGGTGADGFIIAAVLRNQTYTGAGYSIYATSQTSETFPRDAFYQSSPTTPDTGWYYLYVYAYTGSPDSALSRVTLPVKVPSQLTDNIDLRNLNGRFGTVRVAVRDSVHVVLQP